MSDQIKITIDGESIEVPKGTTILQAARMIGKNYPPAMCYYTPLKILEVSAEFAL